MMRGGVKIGIFSPRLMVAGNGEEKGGKEEK